jgi:hypothetical protein
MVMFRSEFSVCNSPSEIMQFFLDESNAFRLPTESEDGKMAFPVLLLIHMNE